MIPFDFESSFEEFGSVVPVYVLDSTGTLSNGEWTWGTFTYRKTGNVNTPFRCIVLADSPVQDAALYQVYNKEGASMAGAINIVIDAELFLTDPANVTGKQSFIEYNGIRFRVSRLGQGFIPNMRYRSYTCVRYLQ